MQRYLIALLLMGLAPLIHAQDFSAAKPAPRQIVPVTVVQPKPSIEGIVKDIFVTKKPWQLVNPVAPAKYGTGEKLVSKDFGPGTPYHSTGWVVAGVEW